jgi:hypothetical protein
MESRAFTFMEFMATKLQQVLAAFHCALSQLRHT